MDSTKHISSSQNPLIKKLLLLRDKSRARKKEGLFVVEGEREISLALKANYVFETLLFCPELGIDNSSNLIKNTNANLIQVTKAVYEKVAYRGTTEGIIGICKAKDHELASLTFATKNPLVLVAEAPEKPGNIGALLRTADAANIDAVLIANPKTDLYNSNIIRSSVGCVFTRSIAMGSTDEIIAFLKEKNIAIYCAALMASKKYTTCDYKEAAAIVVGTEAIGLSDVWLINSNQNIIIPMEGEIDSMNVSVSAAILIFEAKRQRELQ